MIIPFVQLPPVVRYSPHDSTLRHFFNYIDRLGVLGYVMLACSDRWDRKTGLFELTKVVQANAVFMCGFVVRDVEVASHLLDKGLGIAFFTLSWTDASTLDVLSPLPRSRIGVNIAATDESTIMEEITSHHGMFAHFMLSFPKEMPQREIKRLMSLVNEECIVRYRIQVYYKADFESHDEVATTGSGVEGAHAVFHPAYFVEEEAGLVEAHMPYVTTHHPRVDCVEAFLRTLQSDRDDALMATVVCDETGHCLGLVYSNSESIRSSFRKRSGVYWSRSRKELWEKGLTSGCWQELLHIKRDCDGDALQFVVIQHGRPPAFCHLLQRSCFGPATGLRKLEQMLKSRMTEAPEGSYTKQLMQRPELLKSQVLKEVDQLFDANDKDTVGYEAADLMYYLMTRCVSMGVSLHEIERHLDRRSLKINRPGTDSQKAAESEHSHRSKK